MAGSGRRFRQVGADTVEKVGVAVDAKFCFAPSTDLRGCADDGRTDGSIGSAVFRVQHGA